MPIEMTTEWIKDERLLESCRQFYSYVTETYDDILEDPHEYEIMPDYPNENIERIDFHVNLIEKSVDIAAAADYERLVVKTADYDKFMKTRKTGDMQFNKIRVYGDALLFKKLLGALQRRGMAVQRNETETIITHGRYPQMFLAAHLLHQAELKYHGRVNRTPQFLNMLDFREIQADKRKAEIEDVIYGMYDGQKKLIYKFIGYVSQKVKLGKSCFKLWYYKSVDFTYDKKLLFRIGSDSIEIPFPDPGTDLYNRLEKEIGKLPESEEIKEFCVRNISKCRYCNPGCVKANAYKKDWLLFGRSLDKLVESCRQVIRVYEFNETEYNFFKKLIDIYIAE